MATFSWNVRFLQETPPDDSQKRFLIILNQPFSPNLFDRLWKSSGWRGCADGGANRLYDNFTDEETRSRYIPDLLIGDFDSIRPEVKEYYEGKNVLVRPDTGQYSTDLMKCVNFVETLQPTNPEFVLLGGLSGRLDQTVHILSYLHKLRTKFRVFAVTDDNVAWVLDTGEHEIEIDHNFCGQTCGLLPVGVAKTMLNTRGLKWNMNMESSFDGLVSTSNHLLPGENVWIKTTAPIWWTVELKNID